MNECEDVADNSAHTGFAVNESVHEMANGCIENSFLDVSELLSTLQNHSFEESHPSIPFGTKTMFSLSFKTIKTVTKGPRVKKVLSPMTLARGIQTPGVLPKHTM